MGGVVDAVVDIVEDVVDIAVDIHLDALNTIVGGTIINVVDVVEGTLTLTEAAISGDMDALLTLASLVASAALAVGSAGTGSTWFASTLSIVSAWGTIYNIASTLESIGAISQQDLDYLNFKINQLEQQSLNAYMGMSLISNKNKWMAGGIYYNEVYAGGELFNVTGSRTQFRFLGKPDANTNKRLGHMLGNTHDFHRITKTHNIGTDNFSVFTFGKK